MADLKSFRSFKKQYVKKVANCDGCKEEFDMVDLEKSTGDCLHLPCTNCGDDHTLAFKKGAKKL